MSNETYTLERSDYLQILFGLSILLQRLPSTLDKYKIMQLQDHLKTAVKHELNEDEESVERHEDENSVALADLSKRITKIERVLFTLTQSTFNALEMFDDE